VADWYHRRHKVKSSSAKTTVGGFVTKGGDLERRFLEGEPNKFSREKCCFALQRKNARQTHEMSRTFQIQRTLSAIFGIASCPAPRTVLHTRCWNIPRSLSASIPTRLATGFSVSFAPEPEEPETQASVPSQASLKKAKGKKKPPTQEVKTQQEHEHLSERGSKEIPDNAAAVARLKPTTADLQNNEVIHVEGAQNSPLTNGPAGGPEYGESVGLELEEDLLTLDGLTKESLRSEDYLGVALGGGQRDEKITTGDSQPAFVRKKKKEKVKKKHSAEFFVGPGSVIDEQPVKPTAPPKPAETVSQPALKGLKKGKPHTSDTPSSGHASVPNPTPKGSRPGSTPKADTETKSTRPPTAKKEPWQAQKETLQKKFGSEGWNPRKKLSPDTIDGIRALNQQYPDKYPTPVLAEKFKVSPEAIRRILKSKWRPSPEKAVERRERWARRHDRIWDQQAAIGLRPARTKVKKPKDPGDPDAEAGV
jgi:hypothetical protein